MAKLINATALATVGYRMQVILFDNNWIRELENIIAAALAKTSTTHIYNYAF